MKLTKKFKRKITTTLLLGMGAIAVSAGMCVFGFVHGNAFLMGIGLASFGISLITPMLVVGIIATRILKPKKKKTVDKIITTERK